MSWRSIVIANPAELSLHRKALQIRQADGVASVPLEDVSALIIDHPQVTITASILSAFADAQIAVLTVGANHHPNGVLLPFLPHSRALKIMRAQLALKLPTAKQLWKAIVRQKIRNQSEVLERQGQRAPATRLRHLADDVRSGDIGNLESQAAQVYFRGLFGREFSRNHDRFENSAFNYGYAIVRAALARTLSGHGFLPAVGLFHRSEQNAFNLADDLLEPFRPLVDEHALAVVGEADPDDTFLTPSAKVELVRILHVDVRVAQSDGGFQTSTVLAAIEATVESLARVVVGGAPVTGLLLPTRLSEAPALAEFLDGEEDDD